MSESIAAPPPIPTSIPNAEGTSLPLGAGPGEQAPIPNFVAALEALLRQPRRVWFQLRQTHPGRVVAALLALAVASSLVYGLVVGTFSGAEQLWAAPAKIAAGLVISALICLPSLYIFSCLSGSQARLMEVSGLVAGLLALSALLLVGFAPVAWVFSQSTESVAAIGALHLAFWLVATWFGWRFLHSGFAHLCGKPSAGLRAWIIIFLLVVLQMSTALRPIIGRADTLLPTQKQFFLSHWTECLQQ